MVKLSGWNAIGGRRLPALATSITMYELRGVVYARRRRNRRKLKLGAPQLETMDLFRQLAEASKRITTPEYESGKLMTTGTQYLWRDAYYMALTGRLWTWYDEDGNNYMSTASRATMSAALDALGTAVNGLMVRGPNFWEAVAPGPLGYVLVSGGPDAIANWAPLPETGASRDFATHSGDTLSTTNFAAKGNLLSPFLDVQIDQVIPWAGWISGATYEARVYESDGTTIGNLLADSPVYTAPSSFTGPVVFTLNAPVTLAAGSQYWVAIVRTSGTGTTNARLLFGSLQLQGWPAGLATRGANIASINPVSGNALDFGSGFVQNIGLTFAADDD